MRVLFVMRHSGYVRNFESTLRLLCERGHKVELAFPGHGTHWLLDAGDIAQQLQAIYPRFTRSTVPERADAWGRAARELRHVLDYLRYLEPAYRDAPKLRQRAARDVPQAIVSRTAIGVAATAGGRRVLAAGCRALHRAIPSDPRLDAFLEARRPDVLVVTPLIQPGAPQAEYLRSARALGIRTALCVASWDNLTNKGVIHGPPDLVTVWNDAMKREAVEMHGVAPAAVVVTGAQAFDHWFDWRPRRTRADFCHRVGLPADRPYLLYLCSSRFVAPDEVPFVRHWVQALRGSPSPALREVGVLVRPHPQNAAQWGDAAVGDGNLVSVWPPGGAAPADDDTRADYFDSIYHSAAVVAVNTTAAIEAAIIGRPVYTVLAPEFHDTQAGTLHFHHLRNVNGGLVHVAGSLAEHLDQVEPALRQTGADERCRRFVEAFVRPFGLNKPATPRLVAALERLVKAPAPHPVGPPRWAPLFQPALARRGAQVLRRDLRTTEVKAIREAARARARIEPAAPPERSRKHWQTVVSSFLALDYRDRIRFAKSTLDQMPGEALLDNLKPERLDYPGTDVYLRVTTKAERQRLKACAKEPFTIDWIHGWMRPGEVFYDIGANVGVYSLVAARRAGGGLRVYAFEPSYQNVSALCVNIVLNDAADRVTPFAVALSDVNALVPFGLRTMAAGSARHSLGQDAPEEGPVVYQQPVFAARLDDLVQRLGLPQPNHMKLDVDGGEMAVLAGAAATLASPAMRSLLVEVSASLTDDLTRALARFELRLERRFNVQNRAGEDRIWYGLFTREQAEAGSGREPEVEFVSR